MNQESRVAVFVDAENLTQWIKLGGLEVLLEDLSSMGTVVVRKAYGRWTNSALAVHQATLNRHGFELIHTFHPVSGKNSADIQITVDVMEYAWRDDLACIALATGDSDFSPLFRRLREMGKQVVGIGPRSALSESVKSSCSRFFYAQTEKASANQDDVSRASAFDDAADLLEKALKTFDGPANCSALKNLMLNLDSAFDEKSMGFKSFTAFVKAVDGIELRQDDNTWCAIFADNEPAIEVPPQQSHTAEPNNQTIDSSEGYRRILRKKHWRSLPTAVLSQCYQEMQKLVQFQSLNYWRPLWHPVGVM
ncbi:MAG: NYN domain-containing protein [Candidatus Thiodiazotropha sp.]